MHGAKRVLVFCLMTTVIPSVLIITPLYLKHNVFAEVTYPVAESDVIVMQEGVSSIFCESLSLKMNSSFHAFQLQGTPQLSSKRKHIRLKKSMILPDDTLEYWGFYLLKGASVKLKVCSRFDGSRLLVVRGEKNLKTCGLLEHNYEKIGAKFDTEHNQVKVTYEKPAEMIGMVDKQDFLEGVGGEDLTNGEEEVDVFVRKRIEKGRAKQQQKQNFDDEPNMNADRLKRHETEENNKKILEEKLDSEEKLDGEYKIPLDDETLLKDRINNKTRRILQIKEMHSKNKKSAEDIGRKERANNLRQMLDETEVRLRKKRNIAELDAHIKHGGNAMQTNLSDIQPGASASVSSFETDLLSCYNGQILLTQDFPPSDQCNDVVFLEKGNHMVTIHEVASDGYYYYIFYSDNDFYKNDIHTIFDIYKPTYRYANTSIQECVASNECKFNLGFLSDEMVIVEVPTRDGIEHEADDITLLTSTCHPRMSVYMIFPILVLLLILGCAFL